MKPLLVGTTAVSAVAEPTIITESACSSSARTKFWIECADIGDDGSDTGEASPNGEAIVLVVVKKRRETAVAATERRHDRMYGIPKAIFVEGEGYKKWKMRSGRALLVGRSEQKSV